VLYGCLVARTDADTAGTWANPGPQSDIILNPQRGRTAALTGIESKPLLRRQQRPGCTPHCE